VGSQAGTTTDQTAGRDPSSSAFRFGRAAVCQERESGEWSVQWQLRRNCSMAPAQLFAIYASFCVLAFGIAGLFWLQGASLVLPFAVIEVAAVGVALLIYARHAADCESIRLQQGRLVVECANGRRTERVEFQPDWVRIEPEHGDGSLIELSGRGQKISVGRFVRPELRRQLADELRWALRRWRVDMARNAL
jgi:uncharacterized membrane protein